jgi:cytochrome P450
VAEEDAFRIPAHVTEDEFVDFDVYNHSAAKGDLHLGLMAAFAGVPDIFYTPRNGGHWVVTKLDLIQKVTGDSAHFSSRNQNIPKTEGEYRLIPLYLDPPESGQYRAVLMKHFSAKAIADMELSLRRWARLLIDEVVDRGSCNFQDLGARFPVSVFMEMMGLPFDRAEEFRSVVMRYFGYLEPEERREMQAWIAAQMNALIRKRMAQREDDLVSRLIDEQMRGRSLTIEELESICFTLFLAGLDTVANSLAFAFHHLAGDAGLQVELAAHPERGAAFVDEVMRRYAIANASRVVKQDCELEGAQLRAGEMVLCSLPAAGLDPMRNPDPEAFRLDRAERSHAAFSIGPHLCIGHYLARAEIRVLVEEWLQRIPRFRTPDDYQPSYRAGVIMQLRNLPLEWDSGDRLDERR